MFRSPSISAFQSAPPVKGATFLLGELRPCGLFQSAPPVKGATTGRGCACCGRYVSIRAPREGGDADTEDFLTVRIGFNPRPP